jgi:hypothetical protein
MHNPLGIFSTLSGDFRNPEAAINSIKGGNKHHETKTDIYRHSGSSVRVPIDGDVRSASGELRLY